MDKGLIILTDSFPKLTETFIARQVSRLNGIVVTRTFNKNLCYLFKAIDYENVIELGRKNSTGKLSVLVHKIIAKLMNKPTYMWDTVTQLAFQKYIEVHKPSIVLAQFGPLGINALPFCQRYNVPLVVQFFGYDASSLLRNSSYVKSIKEVFQYAQKIIVLNTDMRNDFISLGCVGEKIEVINVGVPVDEITAPERELSINFRFLSVGRLIPKKSPIDTLKAFQYCRQNNSSALLTMVGDGPLMSESRAYIKKHQLEPFVTLTGNLSQADLKKYYEEAHVFLQHSVTSTDGNSEGWPVGIAEACAYGLPIIATAHKGIKDQVVHGTTGYLVEEHDNSNMGKYMLELSLNHEKSWKMGKASRAHILKTGNFNTQIDKLQRVIEEAKQ